MSKVDVKDNPFWTKRFFGTTTGRISSKKPNVESMVVDTEAKSAEIAKNYQNIMERITTNRAKPGYNTGRNSGEYVLYTPSIPNPNDAFRRRHAKKPMTAREHMVHIDKVANSIVVDSEARAEGVLDIHELTAKKVMTDPLSEEDSLYDDIPDDEEDYQPSEYLSDKYGDEEPADED